LITIAKGSSEAALTKKIKNMSNIIHQPLTDQIHYLGVNDTETDLFEALWPLEQGVTYNAYLILDEHPCLIDTVEEKFSQEFIAKLQEILQNKKLEYLVINHMEPDHSGSLVELKKIYPDLKIIGNHKTALFVQGFYQVPEDQVQQVKTGDSLSLGQHELQFTQTPMVHWPESMVTFETKTSILFSSDIFGGFKTLEQGIFAKNYKNLTEFEAETRRYFSNIIGAYTRPAARALKNLKKLEIKMVAPGHGLVWQEQPKTIINWYKKWASLEAEPGATIIHGSMYGHTTEMAQVIADYLTTKNIKVNLLDAARTHTSHLINSIWQYQGLIIGAATYTNDIFPPIRTLLHALSERKIHDRYFGYFGSYSWTGGAYKALDQFAKNSKMEILEPSFRVQYSLNNETKKQALELAKNLAQKLS